MPRGMLGQMAGKWEFFPFNHDEITEVFSLFRADRIALDNPELVATFRILISDETIDLNHPDFAGLLVILIRYLGSYKDLFILYKDISDPSIRLERIRYWILSISDRKSMLDAFDAIGINIDTVKSLAPDQDKIDKDAALDHIHRWESGFAIDILDADETARNATAREIITIEEHINRLKPQAENGSLRAQSIIRGLVRLQNEQ